MRGKITKENKKYGSKFSPKYRVFIILQNNIEDVVKKSTQMWKLIYVLMTIKVGEKDNFEGRKNEDKEGDKEEEIEKEEEDTTMEETQKNIEEMATAEEKQDE